MLEGLLPLEAILPLQELKELAIPTEQLPTTNGGMWKTKDEFVKEIGTVCYKEHARIGMPGIVPVTEEVRAKAGNARLRVRAKDLELLKAAFSSNEKSKDFRWPAVAEDEEEA